jgi:MFS family permease
VKRVVTRLTGDTSKWSHIENHKIVGLAILCIVQFSVATMHARELSESSDFETIEELTPVSQKGQAQDLFLDRAVKSSWENVSATLAEWRQNHFTIYLFSVSSLAGFGVGILAALLGHYGADRRARWRDALKKSTWLAAACGSGVSVLLVGIILSVPSHGRLTYLVFSAVICALGAALACSLCFMIVRRFRQRRAEIAGIFFNEDRMGGV